MRSVDHSLNRHHMHALCGDGSGVDHNSRSVTEAEGPPGYESFA